MEETDEELIQFGGEGIRYKIFKDLMDSINTPIEIEYNINGILNEDKTIDKTIKNLKNLKKDNPNFKKLKDNPNYKKYDKIINNLQKMITEQQPQPQPQPQQQPQPQPQPQPQLQQQQPQQQPQLQPQLQQQPPQQPQPPTSTPEKNYQIVQINIKPKHDLLQETVSLLTNQKFITTYTAVLDQPIIIGEYNGTSPENKHNVAKFKAGKYYLYKNNLYYNIPEPPPLSRGNV